MKSITEIHGFKNEDLIQRFHLKFGVTLNESEYLFLNIKKFLWFLSKRDRNIDNFPIFQYQLIIDLYWHEFILDTKNYTKFCNEFFGFYIHHSPESSINDKAYKYTSNNLKRCINETIHIAGIDLAISWYYEIPERFYWRNYSDIK